ncbi:hypothetical protein J3A83DRAFT_4189714 [Scleroderma citrinum]
MAAWLCPAAFQTYHHVNHQQCLKIAFKVNNDPLVFLREGKFAWLKLKYQDTCAHLKKTGNGILPSGPDANILAEMCHTFPLFNDLDMIWHDIPSFDSELSSSKPNIDCAEKFLSLVQQKMHCDGNNEESHGHDADQAEHNAEGPAGEKRGEGSSINEKGIDDGMQMEFGNDNELCFSAIQFEGGDNPLMDCDELFDGDMYADVISSPGPGSTADTLWTIVHFLSFSLIFTLPMYGNPPFIVFWWITPVLNLM